MNGKYEVVLEWSESYRKMRYYVWRIEPNRACILSGATEEEAMEKFEAYLEMQKKMQCLFMNMQASQVPKTVKTFHVLGGEMTEEPPKTTVDIP
jgi:predicted RNase H-like HicB family nuclease